MMRWLRGWISLILSLSVALIASAQEEIRSFDVNIVVERDGDILVTERLAVNVEVRQIRRGIF